MVEEDGWVDVDELKAKSPISLCEFLLSKVKIQTPIASKKWKIYHYLNGF